MDKTRIKNGLEKIITLFYPKRCAICDCVIKGTQRRICEKCEHKSMYIKEPVCMKCGKEISKPEEELCRDCQRHQHFYIRNFACFSYRAISDSIFRFKYAGRKEYAQFYADEIVKRFGPEIRRIAPDALIPVPIHKKKYWKRGYNQAEVLAKAIGKRMNLPVVSNFVVRSRNTTPQKELSKEERQKNLERAFKIQQNVVKLSTIVIIDDIYTTGSTIDKVAKACLEAGVVEVYSISLAIGKGL